MVVRTDARRLAANVLAGLALGGCGLDWTVAPGPDGGGTTTGVVSNWGPDGTAGSGGSGSDGGAGPTAASTGSDVGVAGHGGDGGPAAPACDVSSRTCDECYTCMSDTGCKAKADACDASCMAVDACMNGCDLPTFEDCRSLCAASYSTGYPAWEAWTKCVDCNCKASCPGYCADWTST